MHSGHILREGARPDVCGTTWVTSIFDVTQNFYGKSW